MSGCQNNFLCQICAQQYKDTNLPRILTMCGHTYCELCISKMITNNISQQQADGGHPFVIQCPQDGAKLMLTVNQLKCFPKNLALIKVIQGKNSSLSFKQESINLSNILKLQQNQQDQLTRQLISTINQCKNQLSNCEVKSINLNASRAEQLSQSNRQPSKQEDQREKQQSKEEMKQIVDKQSERKYMNIQLKADSPNTENLECYKQKAKKQVKLQTKKQEKQQNKKDLQQFAKKQQKQQDDLCLLHQKPLQIICIIDKKKICSKCAIFGQHKGHQFKSVQQVQKQRNECYMEILQIFKQKQQTQQRIQNKQTQQSLMQILNKKKDLLEKQVRQQFRKLRQQVTKQQKLVIKKLYQTYKTTSVKIKSLLKIDEQELNNFNQWQLKSYQLLKVLESNQIQSKVQILYSKTNHTYQLLQNGKFISNKIKSHQQNLVNKVENILENLYCQKNTKIVSLLPEFIDILIREKQKPIQTSTIGTLPNDLQKFEKANNLTVSTLIIENCKQKNISLSDCSIFDVFNQKNIVEEQASSLLQGSPLLEESLLDHQQSNIFLPSSTKLLQCKLQTHQFKPVTHQFQGRKPLQINQNIMNKNIQQDSVNCSFIHLQLQSAKKTAQKKTSEQQSDWNQNGRNSLILTSRPSLLSKNSNGQKPTKKKLKSIKISQKYEKMLQGIYNNTVDTIDLTNAEVGDQIMSQICQFVKYSKARTIKFIRNKLTDVGVQKLLPAICNAQILNLSQNNLTQNVLDIFIKHRYGYLSGLKNIILSQNKIIERKHKTKIEQLRAMNIVVSI